VWDNDTLYLPYEVSDTQLNGSCFSSDALKVWDDDCVEWFIDTMNDGGGLSTPGAAYMHSDDFHGIVDILNIHYDSTGSADGTTHSEWNGDWESAVKVNGTVNSNQNRDGGYSVEVKIPWTSLNYLPIDDSVIGLSFSLADKDTSGHYYIMWPNLSSVAFPNASNWQKVLLSSETTSLPAITNPLNLPIRP
jgi:hypothetical protein